MTPILQDLSPTKVIRAMEENLCSWIPVFGKLGEAHLNHPEGIKRSLTDIPMALFNSVMDARLARIHVDGTIKTIIADAEARNIPILWWIGPSTQPKDLGLYLEKAGFTLEQEAPGMAVDLATLQESLPKPAIFSVQLAEDSNAWQIWSRTMAAGFEAPESADYAVKAWFDVLSKAKPETMLAYTGWLDDKPVATALLFMAAGVAGIYAVSTIPEARRKGMGAYITQYALIQARSEGYKIGVLQSSRVGFGVYRSLGFQEYCKVGEYLWLPEQAKQTAG
jgi:GNAT superfamily N-acetyltransferase